MGQRNNSQIRQIIRTGQKPKEHLTPSDIVVCGLDLIINPLILQDNIEIMDLSTNLTVAGRVGA
jgi:hypothetical protein